MSLFTRDKLGRKIDSDILVFGYIRQDIECLTKQEIPTELKRICFAYWLYKACDSWCNEYHPQDVIKIDGDEITACYKSDDKYSTMSLYGNHVAIDGSDYV